MAYYTVRPVESRCCKATCQHPCNVRTATLFDFSKRWSSFFFFSCFFLGSSITITRLVTERPSARSFRSGRRRSRHTRLLFEREGTKGDHMHSDISKQLDPALYGQGCNYPSLSGFANCCMFSTFLGQV